MRCEQVFADFLQQLEYILSPQSAMLPVAQMSQPRRSGPLDVRNDAFKTIERQTQVPSLQYIKDKSKEGDHHQISTLKLVNRNEVAEDIAYSRSNEADELMEKKIVRAPDDYTIIFSYVDKINAKLKGSRVVVAGGCVSDIIRGVNPQNNFADVDLFVIGPIANANLVSEFYDMTGLYSNVDFVIKTAHALSIRFRNITIQLILRQYESLEALLRGFDIDPAKCAYLDQKYFYLKGAERAIDKKLFVAKRECASSSMGHRVLKYMKRGFKCVVDCDTNVMTKKANETLNSSNVEAYMFQRQLHFKKNFYYAGGTASNYASLNLDLLEKLKMGKENIFYADFLELVVTFNVGAAICWVQGKPAKFAFHPDYPFKATFQVDQPTFKINDSNGIFIRQINDVVTNFNNYEVVNFFNKQNEYDLPDLVNRRIRKLIKTAAILKKFPDWNANRPLDIYTPKNAKLWKALHRESIKSAKNGYDIQAMFEKGLQETMLPFSNVEFLQVASLAHPQCSGRFNPLHLTETEFATSVVSE